MAVNRPARRHFLGRLWGVGRAKVGSGVCGQRSHGRRARRACRSGGSGRFNPPRPASRSQGIRM